MTYSPHTEADRALMLDGDRRRVRRRPVRRHSGRRPRGRVGRAASARRAGGPRGAGRLAGRNRIPEVSFLGAGAYRHLIPSVVGEVIGRPEFATSYTPYQPEVSQGTLQSIYEFQSLICELTGMEVATASHYDGATATAEAALMACRLTRRFAHRRLGGRESGLPPRARDLLLGPGHRGRHRSGRPRRGRRRDDRSGRGGGAATRSRASSPPSRTSTASSSRCATSPMPRTRSARSSSPWSSRPRWRCSRRPGSYGADIVTAEGQPLGIPVSFGGPYVGLMAARMASVRQMPGRLVGSDARRGRAARGTS